MAFTKMSSFPLGIQHSGMAFRSETGERLVSPKLQITPPPLERFRVGALSEISFREGGGYYRQIWDPLFGPEIHVLQGFKSKSESVL